MKRILWSIGLSILVFGCNKTEVAPVEVESYGALKNFMHKGDISAKMDLRELADRKNLYALGAVEELDGEVLVLKGQAYISTVENNVILIDRSFDHKASLLVAADVSEWKEHKIPKEIKSYQALEKYIEEIASKEGIDTEKPFPFQIKGKLKKIDWHVIKWPEGDTIHTHQKHKNSGAKGSIENEKFTLLGFYSTGHHGVFTHHSTNMHLHGINQEENLAGHIDDLELGEDMILLLPLVP